MDMEYMEYTTEFGVKHHSREFVTLFSRYGSLESGSLCADAVSSILLNSFGEELMTCVCEKIEEECLDGDFLSQQDEASLFKLFPQCSYESIAILGTVCRGWAGQWDDFPLPSEEFGVSTKYRKLEDRATMHKDTPPVPTHYGQVSDMCIYMWS